MKNTLMTDDEKVVIDQGMVVAGLIRHRMRTGAEGYAVAKAALNHMERVHRLKFLGTRDLQYLADRIWPGLNFDPCDDPDKWLASGDRKVGTTLMRRRSLIENGKKFVGELRCVTSTLKEAYVIIKSLVYMFEARAKFGVPRGENHTLVKLAGKIWPGVYVPRMEMDAGRYHVLYADGQKHVWEENIMFG